jgi:Helix-turn-helix domain
MSSSASLTERRAPPYTFFDPVRRAYRPQFVKHTGGRSHPFLKKPEGSVVTEEVDVAPAMAVYCRKLIDANLLSPSNKIARLYLGAKTSSAEIIPIPLPPRAPPRLTEPRCKELRSPAPGWHGMDILSIEVDHRLIAELTPDGSAVKIGVAPGTPAARAGLRTGDYVLTVGQCGNGVPLGEFERLHLPAYAQIIVRFHRPGHHRAGEAEMKLLKLSRPPGRKRAPWWERFPKAECGREVQPGKDRAAFAGQMSGHPHMPKVALKILIRLLSYYDGKDGAYPSYSTLARDAGCRRRNTAMENVQALEWLGVLEVRKFEGRVSSSAANKRGGGKTNRFVSHWPEGWKPAHQQSTGASSRTS